MTPQVAAVPSTATSTAQPRRGAPPRPVNLEERNQRWRTKADPKVVSILSALDDMAKLARNRTWYEAKPAQIAWIEAKISTALATCLKAYREESVEAPTGIPE